MLEEYHSKIVCLPLHGHGLPVPGRNRLFLCFYNVEQISGKLFDPFWAPRVPLFHDSFMVVVVRILVFGHFGLKSKPLWLWNLTQNPWDYKTRAQELTSGAIRMLLSFFVRIWELFKDGRVWGIFYYMSLVVNFDIFYNFWYISALDGPIWTKLVTKLKIFWCSKWIW